MIQEYTQGFWTEPFFYDEPNNMDALFAYLRKGLPLLPEEVVS